MSIFPFNGSELPKAMKNFYHNGTRVTGRKGSKPPEYPVDNYRYLGLEAGGGVDAKISDKNESLVFECELHNRLFTTKWRYIFNSSPAGANKLCDICASESGFKGKELYWREKLENLYEDSDITLKPSFPSSVHKYSVFRTVDYLDFICEDLEFDGDCRCGKVTAHKLGNWLHTVNNLDDSPFISCQGLCDKSRKGKALRIPLETYAEKFLGDQWELVQPEIFRTVNERYWYRHKSCGQLIYTSAQHYIKNKHSHRCPYCDFFSPHLLVGEDVNLMGRWVNFVTKGLLSLLNPIIPENESQALEFLCSGCGSQFGGNVKKILDTKFFGCTTCRVNSSTKETDREIEVTLANTRGYFLKESISSVNEQAVFFSHESEQHFNGSYLELVRSLPRSLSGFVSSSNDRSVDRINHGLPYTKADDAVLRRSIKDGLRYFEIASLLGRSDGSVKQRARRLSLRNDEDEHYKRIYSLNDQSFNEVTLESSYWAGFLAADGCIKSNGRGFSLELQGTDETHLAKLLSFLQSNAKIAYRSMSITNHKKLYASVNFTSKQIVDDLKKNFNITQHKSLTLEPPSLETINLQMAFVCGVIDGDGSVQFVRNLRTNRFSVAVVSASKVFIEWLNNVCSTVLTLKQKTIHQRERLNTIYTIIFYENEARQLMRLLYDNLAHDLPLERKKETVYTAGAYEAG